MVDKRVMKRMCFLFFALGATFLGASEEKLASAWTLFGTEEDRPLWLQTSRGWEFLPNIHTDLGALPQIKSSYARRFRLRAVYSGSEKTDPSALQVKILLGSTQLPPLNFVETEARAGRKEGQTEWFSLPASEMQRIDKGDIQSFIRLVSPPTSGQQERLYRLILEAWDFPIHIAKSSQTQVFTAPSIRVANTAPAESSLASVRLHQPTEREEAQMFVDAYLKALLGQEATKLYSFMSDQISILNKKEVLSKYQITPFYTGPVKTLVDYKHSYTARLYSFDEFMPLFPAWEQADFKPQPGDYLFLGGELAPKGEAFFKNGLKSFLIRKTKMGWKIVGVPEQN